MSSIWGSRNENDTSTCFVRESNETTASESPSEDDRGDDVTRDPLNATVGLGLRPRSRTSVLWTLAPFLGLRPRRRAEAIVGDADSLVWPLAPNVIGEAAAPADTAAPGSREPSRVAPEEPHGATTDEAVQGSSFDTTRPPVAASVRAVHGEGARPRPDPTPPLLAASIWTRATAPQPMSSSAGALDRTLPWTRLRPTRTAGDALVAAAAAPSVAVTPSLTDPTAQVSAQASVHGEAAPRPTPVAAPHLGDPAPPHAESSRPTLGPVSPAPAPALQYHASRPTLAPEIIRREVDRALDARGLAPTSTPPPSSAPRERSGSPARAARTNTNSRGVAAPTRIALAPEVTRQLLLELRQMLRDERFRSGIVDR